MEKTPKEEDLRGLEEEIESAINRLFVEKNEEAPQSDFKKSSSPPPSRGLERDLDKGAVLQPPPESPLSQPSIEKLEAQILALEWEITDENIRKTGKEVHRLRGIFQDNHDVVSLLRLMEKALNQMMKNDETIGPPLIRFLLDSKEMLKLLMQREVEGDARIYRKLAYEGMEAKFSLLEGLSDTKVPPPAATVIENQPERVPPTDGGGKMEEMLTKLNLITVRIDRTLSKIEEDLSQIRQSVQEPIHPVIEMKPLPVRVTVFQVDGKLFGVESDKVFKLFRVPDTFEEKHLRQERIRLKDIDVRLIDLKKILALPKGEPRGETKILLVRDDDEYKGLVIGQVVKRLSTQLDLEEGTGGYYTGMVHWTYQERPVAVPVLDLRKM